MFPSNFMRVLGAVESECEEMCVLDLMKRFSFTCTLLINDGPICARSQ